MASMVSAFGTSGSKGSALSAAMRIIISRKASDTVRPMAASTAAASFFTRSSMRARTTAFFVMAISFGLQCSTDGGACIPDHRAEQTARGCLLLIGSTDARSRAC